MKKITFLLFISLFSLNFNAQDLVKKRRFEIQAGLIATVPMKASEHELISSEMLDSHMDIENFICLGHRFDIAYSFKIKGNFEFVPRLVYENLNYKKIRAGAYQTGGCFPTNFSGIIKETQTIHLAGLNMNIRYNWSRFVTEHGIGIFNNVFQINVREERDFNNSRVYSGITKNKSPFFTLASHHNIGVDLYSNRIVLLAGIDIFYYSTKYFYNHSDLTKSFNPQILLRFKI